jgi:hypothetical protein
VDDEDYVRPRDRRPQKQAKPKGPAQPPKGTGPVRKPVDPSAVKGGPKTKHTPAPAPVTDASGATDLDGLRIKGARASKVVRKAEGAPKSASRTPREPKPAPSADTDASSAWTAAPDPDAPKPDA